MRPASCSTSDTQNPPATIAATTKRAIRAARRDGGSFSSMLWLTPGSFPAHLSRCDAPVQSRILILAGVLLASAARAADRYFLTSDGVRLHYGETGQGRTIVMVPGWTMPAWIFETQIRAFSQHYRVIAFDPRSQGDSDVAATGHDPWRRGQDIAELIDRLGPDPVLLMGWSLGVLDSLAYVHTYGDRRLAGLVLVDNSVGEDPPPSGSGGSAYHGRKLSRAQEMRFFVAGMFLRPQPQPWLDRLTEACLRTPPEAASALRAYPVPRTFWKAAVYSTAQPVLLSGAAEMGGAGGQSRRPSPKRRDGDHGRRRPRAVRRRPGAL